jgi:hypothetical protein
VLASGTIVPGGDAAVAALGLVGATRPLERAIVALRGQHLARAAYALVAENRDWLGRFLPDGPAPRRFP